MRGCGEGARAWASKCEADEGDGGATASRALRRTLLRATTKGVFFERSMCSDSIVCGSRPCIMSITRIAMSQSDEPRERRLENDSWPGLSQRRSRGDQREGIKPVTSR